MRSSAPDYRTIDGKVVKIRALAGLNDGIVPGHWKVTAPGLDTIVVAFFRWQAFNQVKKMMQ